MIGEDFEDVFVVNGDDAAAGKVETEHVDYAGVMYMLFESFQYPRTNWTEGLSRSRGFKTRQEIKLQCGHLGSDPCSSEVKGVGINSIAL